MVAINISLPLEEEAYIDALAKPVVSIMVIDMAYMVFVDVSCYTDI